MFFDSFFLASLISIFVTLVAGSTLAMYAAAAAADRRYSLADIDMSVRGQWLDLGLLHEGGFMHMLIASRLTEEEVEGKSCLPSASAVLLRFLSRISACMNPLLLRREQAPLETAARSRNTTVSKLRPDQRIAVGKILETRVKTVPHTSPTYTPILYYTSSALNSSFKKALGHN